MNSERKRVKRKVDERGTSSGRIEQREENKTKRSVKQARRRVQVVYLLGLRLCFFLRINVQLTRNRTKGNARLG